MYLKFKNNQIFMDFFKRIDFSKIGQPLFFKIFVMKTKLYYFEN